MVDGWLARCVVGVLLVTALSGCSGGGGEAKDFGVLQSPLWEAGYTWTYQVDGGASFGFTNMEGETVGEPEPDQESEPIDVTLSVYNTKEPLGGEDVYYVRSTMPMPVSFLSGTKMAFTKDQLSHAAAWYDSNAFGGMGGSSGSDDGDTLGAANDPCGYGGETAPPSGGDGEGDDYWFVEPAGQRLPILSFPLSKGKAWDGKWAYNEFALLTYHAEVLGEESVSVPAGKMKAIHVHVSLEVRPEDWDNNNGPMPKMSGRIDAWYGEDVRHYVKIDVENTWESDDGEFRSKSTDWAYFSLKSHALEAGAEEPETLKVPGGGAPSGPTGPGSEPGPAYDAPAVFRIVSDKAGPVNVADKPVTVTFALEKAPNGYDEPGIPTAATLGRPAELQPSQVITWNLHPEGPFGVEADTLTFDFVKGSLYTISAEVRANDACGYGANSYSQGQFLAFWEKTVTQAIGPGPSGSVKVMDFPVEWGVLNGVVSWEMVPTVSGQPVDGGSVRVVGPDSKDVPVTTVAGTPRTVTFTPNTAGNHQLHWTSSGPVAIGDDVKVRVKVDYAAPGYQPF